MTGTYQRLQDLYEDAEIFINGKMNDVKYEYKRSNLKSGGKKLSVPVERKLRRPKQNSKLNHEIKNKTATKRLKRTVLPRPDTEAALKLSKVVEPTESVSDAAEQPSKESECLSENQPSPTREDFPIHNSCSSGMSVEESDARSCVEEIEHVENSEQERPSMKRTEKFKYCVIQFLELPYQDIDEYVCVPWSWIVLRRKMDKKVIVTYPVENPSETAKRVKRRQKPSDDWKFYMSVEKYGTDLYEDAKIFINGKMNDVKYEYKRSNLKNGGKKLPVPVERKISRPKKNVKSNHEIDKPLDFVVTSKKDDKSATKRLKRTALPKPDTEAALKLSKVVEPTESVSDAAEQPSKASECLSENQPSPTREDFPIHNSCSSGMSVEESDARSCVEEIEYVENSEQERPSVFQNSSNLMNSLSNRNPMLDPTFSTELFTVLRNLHTVSANSYTLVDSLRRVIIDNTEAMKDVKQLIVDSRSLNSNIATTCPSTNTTAEVEKISEINKSKQKQRDEEYDDHGDDDTDEVSKKKRFQKRKFVLPPEYDENDSRWTLKHREMAPGLVELMPHTNVYINAVKLSNCKRLSKDCKSLARMLLVEIFTKGALTVCSLTGSRAKAYDVEGATIRPGLDENARTVLLTYVEEYCREKGWTTLDTQSIQNSIRNKIQEFRVKYG